jgi:uncharacterized membrane protein
MGMDARNKAQQRVDRIELFRSELAELEREGALNLTPDQRSRLDAHHSELLAGFQRRFGVDVTDSGKRVSWGMRIASLLGGAALIAALVLFLHRIWGNLPGAVQVAILTTAPLALLAGAEAAFARQADRYYVGLLVLAAGVTFVMELSTLGSVLNLVDSPHILLAWGLFAVLVAYAYGLRLMLGAGLVLLCVYTAALVLSFQGYYWAGFMQRTQWLLPGALVLYCVPWFTARQGSDEFEFVYRACGAGIGLSALLLLSISGDLCCGPLRPGAAEAGYQVIGLLLSAGVVVHGVRLSRKGLVNLGVAGFMVFLFVRLYAWWWQWMPKYLFFLLIGLIAIGLLLVFRRIRSRLGERAVV